LGSQLGSGQASTKPMQKLRKVLIERAYSDADGTVGALGGPELETFLRVHGPLGLVHSPNSWWEEALEGSTVSSGPVTT